MNVRKRISAIVFLLILSLAVACDTTAEPQAEPTLPPEPTAEPTPSPEPTAEPTPPPEPTAEPTATEATVEESPTAEAMEEEATPAAEAMDGETVEYALPGDAVYPEGIAYDAPSNTFFTDSTSDGTLFRGDLATGEVTVFSEGGQDERTTTIGLAVDEDNRRLWVAGGPTQRMFVYAIETGELIKAFQAPEVEQSFINDVAVDSAGNAYFTDSRRPTIFRVPDVEGEVGDLESFVDLTDSPVPFDAPFNVNGIVVTPGDEYLLINHSGARALFRIDIATGEVVQIETDEPVGGDGLALDGRRLFSVENNQIVEIELAADYASGTVVRRFDDPSFRRATTIAKIDGRLLVVNSQFDARSSGNPTLPFTLTGMPIPPADQ